MKNFNQLSNTEKALTVFISLLVLFVFFGALVSTGSLYLPTHAEEGSESSEASTSSGESSGEEDSTVSEDGTSTVSVDEMSLDEISEVSTPSVDELSTPSIDELSEVSEEMEEELSEPSVVSVPSTEEESVESVRSGIKIEDVSDYISLGDDVAVVYEDEKLFFLIPVQVEKTLILDDEGTVVDVQQTLLNRLLSLFSF